MGTKRLEWRQNNHSYNGIGSSYDKILPQNLPKTSEAQANWERCCKKGTKAGANPKYIK